MADDTGELTDPAEIADARRAFLSEPPPILDPDEPAAPAASTADEEGAALDELLAPSAPEGGSDNAPPAQAPAPTDPYAEFGGIEQVRLAREVQQAMASEAGVRALVANGLIALGYEPEAIRQALTNAEAVPPQASAVDDPFADLDDDEVLTVAQTRSLIQQIAADAAQRAEAAAQAQVNPVSEALFEQQQQVTRSYTDAALIGVLGAPPEDAAALAQYQARVNAIVNHGQQYYDPAQSQNPTHIQQVIQKANAELEAADEARFQAYLASKRQARDSQPVHVGGGAGSDGPLPEPKDLNEARAQARAQGFFD